MKTAAEITKLIKDYYMDPANLTGGSLHIALEDGNIEDRHIKYCLSVAIENEDEKGIELAKILLEASSTQRKKAISNK